MKNRQETFTFEGVTFRLSAVVAVSDLNLDNGTTYCFSVCCDGGHEFMFDGGSDHEKAMALRGKFIDLWVHNVTSHE